ncbi:LAMI_0E08834g1_1 [Lachancea mirantina]|uniref:Endoplasmic reticulum lectin n=1 Tax=Lachancea mirantina TaxID=1230905 RepID=A0A1G4JNJ9_9SACH|nr:LAMI_0E08834g1_1 [Lachancea mirantina]
MLLFILGIVLLAQEAVALNSPDFNPGFYPRYSMRYVNSEQFAELSLNATKTSNGSVVYANGPNVRCILPVREFSTTELDESVLESRIQADLTMGLEIISNQFKDVCLVYGDSFWTYMYCHGQQVTQVHFENGHVDPVLNFTLARESNRDENEIEPQAEPQAEMESGEYGFYITSTMSGGDLCRETGKPRSVELQYMCDPLTKTVQIVSVTESRLCHYNIRISVPDLCKIPFLSGSDDGGFTSTLSCFKIFPQEINDPITLTELYRPIFVGHGFFLLTETVPDDVFVRPLRPQILVFTGSAQESFSLQMSEAARSNFLSKAWNAFETILSRELLQGPDGTLCKFGDEFIWVGEVRNLNGDHIVDLRFEIDHQLAASVSLEDQASAGESKSFKLFNKGDDTSAQSQSKALLTGDKLKLKSVNDLVTKEREKARLELREKVTSLMNDLDDQTIDSYIDGDLSALFLPFEELRDKDNLLEQLEMKGNEAQQPLDERLANEESTTKESVVYQDIDTEHSEEGSKQDDAAS